MSAVRCRTLTQGQTRALLLATCLQSVAPQPPWPSEDGPDLQDDMTARRFLPFLTLAFCVGALPAVAQEPKGSGLSLGVRGAYGIPVGDSFEDLSLSDTFGDTVAPQVDVAYFFNRRLSLGGYFQYGIASGSNSRCPDGVSCKGKVLRFGVELDYHFRAEAFISPWVGVGVGYEIGTMEIGQGATNTWFKLEGYDLGHAHFGVDFQLTRSIAVGPYVSASVGEYSDASLRLGTAAEQSEAIPSEQKKLHVWIQPGVRVQFRL
jgi:outer membrane protein W